MSRNILSIGESGRTRELTISGAYSKNPILIVLERKNVGAAEVLRFSFAEAIRLNHALTQVIKQIKEGKYEPDEESLLLDGIDGFEMENRSREGENEG